MRSVADELVAPATDVNLQAYAITRAAAPSIIGTWQGTVAVGAGSYAQKLNFRLQVASQTRTSLTGTVTIGRQTYRGTGAIRWSGRKFTINYAKGHVSLTMQGSVNSTGNSISATASAAGRVMGYMSAKKVV